MKFLGIMRMDGEMDELAEPGDSAVRLNEVYPENHKGGVGSQPHPGSAWAHHHPSLGLFPHL